MWTVSQHKLDNRDVKLKTYCEHGANLTLFEQFFDRTTSDHLLKILMTNIHWKQNTISLFGKTHLEPRLTAWYGDPGIEYTYSGIKNTATKWSPELLTIKKAIERSTALKFNSVLLNLYRDGNDSMGWHQDNEKSLGRNPAIASVSFGSSRHFKLKHVSDNIKTHCLLEHGSLLVMKGDTQDFWKHHIPKTKKVLAPRINLTFRKIIAV